MALNCLSAGALGCYIHPPIPEGHCCHGDGGRERSGRSHHEGITVRGRRPEVACLHLMEDGEVSNEDSVVADMVVPRWVGSERSPFRSMKPPGESALGEGGKRGGVARRARHSLERSPQ